MPAPSLLRHVSPAALGNPAARETPKEEEMGIIGLLVTIVVVIILLRLIA